MVVNNVKTLLWEYEAARDDSGTDRMFDVYRIAVEGIVTAQASQALPASGSSTVGTYGIVGANAPAALMAAVELLKQDRKPFKYEMDGETLLEVAESDIPDADNGPKVQRVRVVHFTPLAYRIQFEVVIAVNPCGGAIVSNRWACADTVDDNFRTTRVWRGRLRVGSSNVDPQDFRRLCLPSILKGWRRRNMHFTGEPNGLELTYEVVDEQMLGDSPPWPAIRMSGTHIETLTMQAYTTISEVNLRLDGAPGTDRQELIIAGLSVLDHKLHFASFLQSASSGAKSQGVFRNLYIAEHFGDSVNAIEVKATVQRLKSDEQASGPKLGNLIGETLGAPLDMQSYDRFRPLAPSAYPSSLANLFACYLQTPCGNHAMPQGMIPQGSQEETEEEEDQPPESTYNPTSPTVQIPEPTYSDEHKEFIYVHANVESIYLTDHGYLALPQALAPGAAGDSVAHIRIAPKTAKRRVKLSVERLGKQPLVWDAVTFTDKSGIKHVPIHDSINLRPPEPQGDGTMLYVHDQEILFSLSRAPTVFEKSLGSLPWTNQEPVTIGEESVGTPGDNNGP